MFCLQPASCTCARTKKEAPLQRLDGPPRASPLKHHRRQPNYRYIGCLAHYILILLYEGKLFRNYIEKQKVAGSGISLHVVDKSCDYITNFEILINECKPFWNLRTRGISRNQQILVKWGLVRKYSREREGGERDIYIKEYIIHSIYFAGKTS